MWFPNEASAAIPKKILLVLLACCRCPNAWGGYALHKSRALRAAVAKQLHVVEAATAGPQSDTGPVASSHRPEDIVGGECFWVIEMVASDHP